LSTASNLVNDLHNTGDFDDAAALAAETVEQYTKLLGENHPYTLAAKNNFAIVLRQSGRVE
jgi:hypothetical protein